MAKKKVKAYPGNYPFKTFTGFRMDFQLAFGGCSNRNDLSIALSFYAGVF